MDSKKKKDASMTEETTASEGKRKPEKWFRDGDVAASIFVREVQTSDGVRVYRNVSPTRSYKDAKGQYKYANSFDRNDLRRLIPKLQEAQQYLDSLAEAV